MSDWFSDVLEFHRKFGCHIGSRPDVPNGHEVSLRDRLMWEEYCELMDAIDENSLDGLADSIVDLIYVLLGTAISYGIDVRPVWDMVHRANMAKFGGGTRCDGKIMKPDGWVPPDVAGEIRRQCHG